MRLSPPFPPFHLFSAFLALHSRVRFSHPSQSSEKVIRVSHPSRSSESVIRVSHQSQSSESVIRVSHPTQSSESVIRVSHYSARRLDPSLSISPGRRSCGSTCRGTPESVVTRQYYPSRHTRAPFARPSGSRFSESLPSAPPLRVISPRTAFFRVRNLELPSPEKAGAGRQTCLAWRNGAGSGPNQSSSARQNLRENSVVSRGAFQASKGDVSGRNQHVSEQIETFRSGMENSGAEPLRLRERGS